MPYRSSRHSQPHQQLAVRKRSPAVATLSPVVVIRNPAVAEAGLSPARRLTLIRGKEMPAVTATAPDQDLAMATATPMVTDVAKARVTAWAGTNDLTRAPRDLRGVFV